MPGMPAGMNIGAALKSMCAMDPELSEMIKKPKVAAAMEKIAANPQNLMNPAALGSDPEVSVFVQKLMGKIQQMMGSMGMGGGMPGMPPGAGFGGMSGMGSGGGGGGMPGFGMPGMGGMGGMGGGFGK